MYRTRPVEDPIRRWRRFCRAGWGLAALTVVLWTGGLMAVFRIAPGTERLPREAPPRMHWWAGRALRAAEHAGAADVRAVWSPSVFSLPTPAGFSHSLRRGRVQIAPPVHLSRAEETFLPGPDSTPGSAAMMSAGLRLSAPAAAPAPESRMDVFRPREVVPEAPRLVFPDGWESRLFSGIDLAFGRWTRQAWEARIEMRFDASGVPTSMLLTAPSGIPDVDRRLVRQAWGWRLLEPGAPRTGTVLWRNPGTAGGGAP